MENGPSKRKPVLVILQSYYDRDVSAVDSRSSAASKMEPTASVKNQVAREKVEIAAPPPPPAPPAPPLPSDENLASRIATFSFDKSNPPPCPTPDYDSSSMSSGSSLVIKTMPYLSKSNPTKPYIHASPTESPQAENTNAKSSSSSSQLSRARKMAADGDRVEMISIESFTLNNPSSPRPKPPATYFGTMNGAKKPKSVAVTIGEYPSSVDRKQPTRFHFLPASADDKNAATNGDKHVGHLLQSELAQTLSRSNLKNQTDKQGNSVVGLSKKSVPSNGTTIISVNNETSPSDMSNPRTVSNTNDDEAGRTLVHVGSALDLGQSQDLDACPLNGILKHVTSANLPNVINGK